MLAQVPNSLPCRVPDCKKRFLSNYRRAKHEATHQRPLGVISTHFELHYTSKYSGEKIGIEYNNFSTMREAKAKRAAAVAQVNRGGAASTSDYFMDIIKVTKEVVA